MFVHVPKTAGTTFRTILVTNEPDDRVRPLHNIFKGTGGADTTSMRLLETGRGLMHTRLQDLDDAAVLRGHVVYGLREHLPRYLARGRKVRWFTFLREPVDRLVSHYFQICELRRDAPGVTVPWSRLRPEPALEELIEAGYLHDNLHTRMLSGDPEPFGEVDDAMLERARVNLREGMLFFGITERFDESLVLAKRRLGLRSVLHDTSARVNEARPRGQEVSKALARAAKRANRHDAELYRYARELFDAAPELGELDFRVEVEALRAARGRGMIAAEAPAPEGFSGSREEWRMLLRARADLLRLERPHALDEELRAARRRVAELEGELKRLRRARRRKSEARRGG